MDGWICHGFREFLGRRDGASAVTFALAIVPLIAISGLAMDYARLLRTGTDLQAAVDAAALTAAAMDASLRDAEARRVVAAAFVGRDTSSIGAIDVVNGADGTVNVRAAATLTTTLTALFGASMTTAKQATAVTRAAGATNDRACVLALQTAGDGVATNNSRIDADCGIYANSVSSNAIDIAGSSTVKATSACVVGGYRADSGATISPTPNKGCAPLADPFTGLVEPAEAAGACQFNNLRVTRNRALDPGVYCGGLQIDGGIAVSFNPGVYVIRDGRFSIGSSATVTGADVLFYLNGLNSTADWGSNANVQLRGLKSGPLAGVVFWNPSANVDRHNIGCGSTSIIEGSFYSPRTEVEIGSNGIVNASADWTVWVVKRLQIGSSSSLVVRAAFSGSQTPAPAVVSGGALRYQLANANPVLMR